MQPLKRNGIREETAAQGDLIGPDVQVSIFPVRAQPLLRFAVGIVGKFSAYIFIGPLYEIVISLNKNGLLWFIFIFVFSAWTHTHTHRKGYE